jgi:hypothetical protein
VNSEGISGLWNEATANSLTPTPAHNRILGGPFYNESEAEVRYFGGTNYEEEV